MLFSAELSLLKESSMLAETALLNEIMAQDTTLRLRCWHAMSYAIGCLDPSWKTRLWKHLGQLVYFWMHSFVVWFLYFGLDLPVVLDFRCGRGMSARLVVLTRCLRRLVVAWWLQRLVVWCLRLWWRSREGRRWQALERRWRKRAVQRRVAGRDREAVRRIRRGPVGGEAVAEG